MNPVIADLKNESNYGFFHSLDSFTQGISELKINLKPFSSLSVAKFMEMPNSNKDRVQSQFQSYMDLIGSEKELPREDGEVSEQKLLQSCARKLGLVFDPNVYTKLQKQDIVEVYNQDLIQIYRSLSFFNLCSYNLLDLLTHEWYELYERSLQVNHHLLETGTKLMSRPYNLEPLSLMHIPQHIMREKFSEERISFLQQFKEMYPIYTWKRDFYGYLIVLEAQKLDKPDASVSFI